MSDKIFVDTNVWVYLFLQEDDKKYKIAENFLVKDNPNAVFVISWQIINEVSNTLLRYKYEETEIRKYIEQLCKVCTIQEFTKETVLTASSLREKYSLSFWDRILVGSALISECNLLISEDMQNGLNVDKKLIVKNIFRK
jgi:predicted nucleic acid-binding protein